MNTAEAADTRIRLSLSLAVMALIGAAIFVPYLYRSEAVTASKANKGLVQRTESHEPGLENYDIRLQKSDEVAETLQRFRSDEGQTAYGIADARDQFVRGEEALRGRVRTLKVEYNNDLRIPEVITPDVWKKDIESLTQPSDQRRSEILRNFVKQNSDLVGINDRQADTLEVVADYKNPEGELSFAQLEQRINGIPVFRGEVKAGFRKDGSMIRVINNLAPGLDYESISTKFGSPRAAVDAAARHINVNPKSLNLEANEALSNDIKSVFGDGPSATTAEKMYFPTEVGVARPAWRVLIWQPVNAFYVIVDGETGTMLWRKNITEDQTESATYNVYRDSNGMIDVARSPFVWTPGPLDPSTADAATPIVRAMVARIGNEGAYSFNTNGWITDGTNGMDGWTDGNNAEAGLDVVAPDGVDAPVAGVARVFDYANTPFNPNDGTGEGPTTNDNPSAGVVQLFYICNWYHDEMYRLGWTEEAFNFQASNFGRGGIEGDRVRCESQDSSGTNNANFSTPADGGRGRMQMYRWTLEGPGLDGSLDADIVIHEFTHGLSNRLHGNSAGLGSNMSRMMGEGWSDFYSHALLSQASEPANGINTLSGWATSGLLGGLSSYYYGIRRFPKAPIAFTGGAGNLPHNPITFADVDQTTVDYSDGAFAAPVAGHLSSTADQVHSGGEVWSSALWEVRTLMVTRLGWADGNRRALQVVTDGMKLAPLNPDYLQERDAIIAAASALAAAPEASADVADVREGFRLRGMGFGAVVNNAGTGGGSARVTEAFDFPNVSVTDPFSVSDAPGDGDGFPEPGENVLLSIAVENTTGGTMTNVTVSVNGQPAVSYGTINDGQTVSQEVPYTIPASLGAVACGAFFDFEIVAASDAGTQSPVTRQTRLGAPIGGGAQTFESADGPIDLPGGQPTTTSGPADPYPSTISVSGLTGNKVVSVELTDVNHTWVGDLDMLLESPGGQKFIMMSDAFSSSNRTGTVVTTLTLRDDAADTMPSSGVPPTSGTFKPTNHGANDPFDGPAPAGPYENPAPGGSATFQSTFGMDGTAMNGDWKLWIDDDASSDPGSMPGWKITFESDDYVCNLVTGPARADFDGDGRTDVSVFRPSEGNWYINGSNAGFFGLNWGQAGDVLVPADYDGDGTTDVAVARMEADQNMADFYVINSETLTFTGYSWGEPGDIPLAGDYNGDGKDDVTVFRPSENTWYTIIDGSTALIRQYGNTGDTPIVGDFDGDGTDDLATWNAGVINAQLSGGGNLSHDVGGNMNVSGDWDGDGKHDTASFNTSNGEWKIWMSMSDSLETFSFGIGTDIPAPGDYDGDGKLDLAIYRDGEWWIYSSLSGTVSVYAFGVSGDGVLPLVSTP